MAEETNRELCENLSTRGMPKDDPSLRGGSLAKNNTSAIYSTATKTIWRIKKA